MHNLDFFVLGSGSSGNCSLIRIGERWVMIDAGFSMKQTKERMRTHAVQINDVSDVLVTHFDRDHFNPAWSRTLQQRGINVHLHEKHIPRAIRAGLDGDCLVPFTNQIQLYGTNIETIRFAHDALGTVGFIFDTGEIRFGFATDLGHVPQLLLDRFVNLDGVALESNYDPMMQQTSNRPESLKHRIMNGEGHLSNEQSLAAICHIASESELQHIVLLHLSRQCNSPHLIRDLYLHNCPDLHENLTITTQDRCSRRLSMAKPSVKLA